MRNCSTTPQVRPFRTSKHGSHSRRPKWTNLEYCWAVTAWWLLLHTIHHTKRTTKRTKTLRPKGQRFSACTPPARDQ